MLLIFGLGAALGYGLGDFCGGMASKRMSSLWLMLCGQIVSLPASLVLVGVLDGDLTWSAVTAGVVTGATSTLGLGVLYRGLADGSMGVVAALSSAVSAVVPTLWDISRGNSPSPRVVVGLVVVLGAVWLLAAPGSDATRPTRRGLIAAVVSGGSFGAATIALSSAPDESGAWPVVAERVTLTIIACVAVTLFRIPAPGWGVLRTWPVLVFGAADTMGTTMLLFAGYHGSIAAVGALISTYPAWTALFAFLIIGERLGRLQIGGIMLAFVGAALLA